MMSFQKLRDRYMETRQYKDRWLALYKDLYYYVIPDRDAFNVKFNYVDTGKPTTLQIWDNTAVTSAYQRANDLHGLLLPKDRRWGKYVLDPHKYPQDYIDASQTMLDEINSNILFYLGQSNLAQVVASSNLDLVGGTGAIWIESHSDEVPLYFRSIPTVCLYIEYSTDDTLGTCWYQVKMLGRQILENFPDYNGTKITALKESPDQQYIVIYGQIKMAEGKFYIYATMEDDPMYPLFEAQRSYPQIIIYRDRVRPGESEGRGIGLDLLPTIRDINRIVQYDRQSVSYKAYPPMFVDTNSYFNSWSVRQWAGANIPRNPGAKRNPIEPMIMPDNPHVLERVLDLRQIIKDAFMVEPLGEVDQSVRSATEISIRENRSQRNTSIDISRIINEQPGQIFEVSSIILGERRLLTKDRKVAGLQTKKMRFVFESPLFDLQKQDDLSHFVTNMQIKQQFLGQQVALATLNIVEANKFLTDMGNLPHKLFKNDAEIMQMLNNISQAAQQQSNPPQPTTGALPVPALPQSQVQV